MKEQIVRTEHQYPVNTERERYGRPIRASVGRLRGRNGTDFTHSTLKVCHRLPEEQSDTPRRAGGLMSRAPSNGVGSLVKASCRARLVQHSELPCCSIRFLLLADVAANLFEFKPDRGNGVPSSPQVLAGEVPFPVIQSGHSDGALPF